MAEDDPDIGSMLVRTLEAEDYGVDWVVDGTDAVWRATEGQYAALVLDLLLPGKSGYKVCEELRSLGCAIPILVLTAKDGVHDQLDMFELGADDFVSKPVPGSVIVARLRSLLRRSAPGGPDLSSAQLERFHGVPGLSFDSYRRSWNVGERSVDLSSRETAVLREVARAGEGFVGRQQILDAVWGIDFTGDSSIVDVYLRRIRVKLAPVEIENRRSIGYRIRSGHVG